MELRGYSPMTIVGYIRQVSNFAKFYNKSPKYLGEKEIRDYLHYCIMEKRLSEVDVSEYTTWNEHKSLEDTRDFLKTIITAYKNEKGMTWGIEDKKNGRLIGTCGFVTWIPELKRAEIGYALSKEYWNNGYMTEVFKKLILFGFTNMELVRIEARCKVENIGSAKVMEKAGMKFEGILRKHLICKGQFYDVKIHSIVKE